MIWLDVREWLGEQLREAVNALLLIFVVLPLILITIALPGLFVLWLVGALQLHWPLSLGRALGADHVRKCKRCGLEQAK